MSRIPGTPEKVRRLPDKKVVFHPRAKAWEVQTELLPQAQSPSNRGCVPKDSMHYWLLTKYPLSFLCNFLHILSEGMYQTIPEIEIGITGWDS